MSKKRLPTHRLYVFYKDGKTTSRVCSCISTAWFYGSDEMKKFNVDEIRIVKIKP
jgi:hypothetical protein